MDHVPTPLIGRKTGSTLSVIGWCSGRGSGSPLTRTFTGSKPLLATFLAGLCPYCTGPYLRRRAADGSGKLVDSPIAPSLHTVLALGLRPRPRQMRYEPADYAGTGRRPGG